MFWMNEWIKVWCFSESPEQQVGEDRVRIYIAEDKASANCRRKRWRHRRREPGLRSEHRSRLFLIASGFISKPLNGKTFNTSAIEVVFACFVRWRRRSIYVTFYLVHLFFCDTRTWYILPYTAKRRRRLTLQRRRMSARLRVLAAP